MSRTMTATWWTLPRRRIVLGDAAAVVTRVGHGAPQTVISSRWTPHTVRRRSEISPTVA